MPRKALRCSCRAVACGGPGVSRDSGRRPLVRRRWRRGLRCLSTAHAGDASPAPRPPRSPRQRRPRSRTATCPVVPRKSSDGLPKPPRCRVRDVGLCRPSKQRPIPRSAPAAPQSAVANPCPNAGASPRRTPEYASIPEAAPGRRWPAWPPRPSRRIPACRPVSRSAGAPADHAAQGGSKVAPPYHAAPRRHHRCVFSIPHRCCAPAPFRALSLPTSPPRAF